MSHCWLGSHMKLELRDVGKKYKADFWGLKSFSLSLEPGVVGLLGENGAGKSTLMRIIATISKPTVGQVFWNGVDICKDPNAIRKDIGYLPQDFGVYPNLNAEEFLEYIGVLKGINIRQCKKRIRDLLELVNLSDARKKHLGSYSGGMRQRIGIAQALLNDPKILIVDEPTAGLDPTERVRFRNLLSDISGQRIVLFSTHIVSDIESTAGKIAILSKGNLISFLEPAQLLKQVEGKVWEVVVSDHDLVSMRKHLIVSGAVRTSEGVKVRTVSGTRPLSGAKLMEPALEDAYLYAVSASGDEGMAHEQHETA